MKKDIFNNFLNSLKTETNNNLLENIKEGFNICFEMAIPREIDIAKTYYHGTSKKENAEGIIKNKGIKPPDLTLRQKTKLTPIQGKVYLTASLEYAIIYALGGSFIGHEYEDKKEPFGYLFVIDGNELKDIQPDEDSVGEILHTLLSGHEEGKYDWERGKNLDWLIMLAKNYLTKRQLDKVNFYDDYADLVVAGRKLLKNMTDEEKLQLIDMGAHVAHAGNIKFKECWKFDKKLSIKLNPNGSNFFELAERII